MKTEDLTGRKFGKLTAVSLAEPLLSSGGSKRTAWLCRCECGRERIVRAAYLKRGTVTHCGYCVPPMKYKAKTRVCRYCEYSTWDSKKNEWICGQGRDPTAVGDKCDAYYCGAYDKVSGVKNRESKCFICGAPIYSHGTDTPIYCKEHKAYAEQDNDALNDIPYEILFTLITGIFLRARDDYIYNADNQRSDAEVFLKGNWAQELSVHGFDTSKLFETLNEVMDEFRETDSDTE